MSHDEEPPLTGEHDLVTIRFLLADAGKRKSHAPEWEFYEGRWMAYFANEPFAWWPEGGPYPFVVEPTATWSAEFGHLSTAPPTTVTLRLPRSLLERELRIPYEIVSA